MEEKSFEDRKIELEVKKLELETGKSKKILEWISIIPNFITAIIAVGTLSYAIQQGVFEKLMKNLENDNKILSKKVDSLNNNGFPIKMKWQGRSALLL